MSLNGLDVAAVREAYAEVLTEPGGWLLLKYASRDEVELHSKGSSGIVEVRNSIAQHGETSPLYGFLRYRRRNVVLKYMPEVCSRLVKARAAVHFTAVCEHFTPHTTTYEFADSKDLKDSKLSAACSLHTASGSTSSSTSSLRRRRLMEIAEEEEEEQHKAKRQSTVTEEVQEVESSPPSIPEARERPVPVDSDLATAGAVTDFVDTPQQLVFTAEEAQRPDTVDRSLDSGIQPALTTSHSQAGSSAGSLYTRARVRLGPRPSVDASGNPRRSSGEGFRPVSSLPSGLKLFSRGGKRQQEEVLRHTSTQSDNSLLSEGPPDVTRLASSDSISQQLLVPTPLPSRPQTSVERPTTSSGFSVQSLPNIATLPAKAAKVTQEKARLLKAMQLRERRKREAAAEAEHLAAQEEAQATASVTRDRANTIPEEDEDEAEHTTTPETIVRDGQEDTTIAIVVPEEPVNTDHITSPVQHDHISVDTQPESIPTSPLVTSSEHEGSTNASSVADATEETLQEAKDESPSHIVEQESEERPQSTPFTLSERQSQSTITPAMAVEDITTTPENAMGELQESAMTNGAEMDEGLSNSPLRDDISVPEAKDDAVSPATLAAAPVAIPSDAALPTKKLIPTSKYSTQNLRAQANPVAAATEQEKTKIAAPSHETSANLNQSNETTKAASRASISDHATDDERAENHHLSDDEDFMAELQSAVVEQATPMTVAKTLSNERTQSTSPIDDRPTTPRIVRTASTPIKGGWLPPAEQATPRVASSGSSFLSKLKQQQPSSSSSVPPKQTGKIGSSISQRIKALEKLSASNAANGVDTPKERPSSTFFAVRKSSVTPQQPPRSPTLTVKTNSLIREITPSPPRSRESAHDAPVRDRSGSLGHRLTVFEGGNAPRGRPDTVQVTARIIRDPMSNSPRMPDLRTVSAGSTSSQLRQTFGVNQTVPPSPSLSVGNDSAVSDNETLRDLSRNRSTRRLSRDRSSIFSGKKKEDDPSSKQEIGTHRRRSSFGRVKDLVLERRTSLKATTSTAQNKDGTETTLVTLPVKSPNRPPSTHYNSTFSKFASTLKRSTTTTSTETSEPAPLSPTTNHSSCTTPERAAFEEDDVLSVSGKEHESLKQRFMRRLSSLNSSRVASKVTSPQSASPPPLDEEHLSRVLETPSRRASQPPLDPNASKITSYLGDVNVQFPDNLLWRRRTMCLDSHGFLILTDQGNGGNSRASSGKYSNINNNNNNNNNNSMLASLGVANGRERPSNAVKKYHLSEFRTPYAPEIEMQELPNSVCMDFEEGGGLQVACADRAGQEVVLGALLEAYEAQMAEKAPMA